MFPEPHPEPAGAVPIERPGGSRSSLGATLEALRRGPVRTSDVAALSDLGRPAAAVLTREWLSLPEATRVAIVREMDELAEERIDLNFGRALRVALDDESPVVRQLAVAALWEDERGDIVGRLQALAATDPSEDVRAEAAKGLGRFAEQAAAGDLTGAVVERLRASLTELAADDATPYSLRRRALESVGVFGGEEVNRLIRQAYDSDEQGFQASALFAMGRSLDRRWLETVIRELASPEAELRFEAARACGAFGDDRAVPTLARLADDPDAEVRHAAIAALGQVGGRAAVRVLRDLAEVAQESDVELVDAALEEALGAVEPVQAGRS